MAGKRTECQGVTGCSPPDDLESQIGLVAVHSHEKADVDLVVPDREVRMIGVDFCFRIDFGIFWAIVGHRDDLDSAFDRCFLDHLGHFGRLFIPFPQNLGTREKGGNFRCRQFSGSFFDRFILGNNTAFDVALARIRQGNPHQGGGRRKKGFGTGKYAILGHSHSLFVIMRNPASCRHMTGVSLF
jgi:hypothetical protein